MRIGIDCRLPTYQMGGISQYVLNLMRALAEIDQSRTYYAFHSRKEKRNFLPDGANWRRCNLWTPPHHWLEQWTLSAEVAPYRLDVLHSPDFIPPRSGAPRRVITIHDLTFIYYPELLTDESKRYYLDQVHWAAESADAISADSLSTKQDIVKHLRVPEEKVTTIHLAANPLFGQEVDPLRANATLQRYGLEPGFFLSVGTLEPRKNLPMLLRIYARLWSERQVCAPLILVGRKGWLYEDVFRTIEQLALESQVIHIETLSDEELHHFYHFAGSLLTPSLYEGFGLPALEAQHCGCPAIVSDRGSLPEIVGDQGLIIPLEDEDRWLDTMVRVRSDADFRMEVIKRGYEQAKKFTWAKTAQLTLALYLGRATHGEESLEIQGSAGKAS